VTMAAIQGLYQQNIELKAELSKKDTQLEDQQCEIKNLNTRVAELEMLEARLAQLEMLLMTKSRNNTVADDD